MRYKLSDLFELQMGKTPSRNNPNYWNSNDYSWVSISDMSSYDKYVSGTKEYISERAVKESGIKTIPANTVIMSFKLSIGKTAITTGPIFSNEAIMAFIDKKTTAIDPEYIFYLFSGKDWDEGSNKAVMGKTLNKATLSNIEVDIPSLDIQKERIEKLNKISILISDKKQQLNQLDKLIKARFVEMFSESKCGTKKLNEITDIITKGTTPTTAGFEFTDSGINFFKIESITEDHTINLNKVAHVSEECHKALRRSQLREGDVLFSIAGAIGRTAIISKGDLPGNNNQALAIIRLSNDSGISQKYLISALDSPEVFEQCRTKKRGVAQINLSLQDVGNIEIPIPSPMEQKTFELFAKQIDKSKFAVQKSLEKTQLLFDSLMQEYFD